MKDADRLREGVDRYVEELERAVETRRALIRDVVVSIATDAQRLAAQVAERGPDVVTSTSIALHVKELVEFQAELDEKRRQLRVIEEVIDP